MKKVDAKSNKILDSKNQLQLYGFHDYFNVFIKLLNKNSSWLEINKDVLKHVKNCKKRAE